MPALPQNHKANIAIWYVHLETPVSQTQQALWESWLDPQEVARMARLQREEHRRRFLVSHALTRDVIARQCGANPREITFGNLPQGKPFVAHPQALQNYFFNLTHSHHLAAIAISKNSPLGLDLEWLGRKGPEIALAKRYFTDREYQDILRQPAEHQHERLLTYWTLKEAYIKAEGWGLSAGLDSFEFEIPAQDGPPRLHICKADAMNRHPWQFRQFKLMDAYLVAIAGTSENAKEMTINLQAWQPQARHARTST